MEVSEGPEPSTLFYFLSFLLWAHCSFITWNGDGFGPGMSKIGALGKSTFMTTFRMIFLGLITYDLL